MKQPKKRAPAPPLDYPSFMLRQPIFDLFGLVVVTHDDLYLWVSAVSPLHLTPRAYANYVRSYDVAGKVRNAKISGRFEAIIARPVRPWHARLALHAIL